MSSCRWLRRAAPFCLLLTGLAPAQQIPFQLNVSQQDTTFPIPNSATLTFSDPVGQLETARITAFYRGRGQATISQVPDVFGANTFTAIFPAKLPLTLNPGESFFFDIQFRPTTTTQTVAQLNLGYTETVTSSVPNQPSTTIVTSGAINLTLQGTAPSFLLSYVLQSDLNVVPLQPGASIVFPATQINAISQVTLNITNRGSGTGQIKDFSITGSPAFRVFGIPLFPVRVDAGQSLQLAIRYQPTAVGSDLGEIQVTLDTGNKITISLQGSGTSTLFVYELLQSDSITPVAPGGSISLPDTNLGETSSLAIRVRNTGSVSGTINSLSVIGTGFQITDGPLLPQNLATNSSFTFTIVFTPTQPGSQRARLIVGSDIFDVVGLGLGPKLIFSYISGGSTITLPANGSVVFSPVMVSRSAQLDLAVKNTGTLAATISNIGVGESRSPFSLSGLPALPLTIAPDSELHFAIVFTPITTGFANGTLRFDTFSVGLTGSGTPPPPLPTYTISGSSGEVAPVSQPALSLKLSSPYPVALVGTLAMSFSGDLTVDPAVQFATGGRTVPFAIPANTTDANFAGQGTQIRLQTGTVANTVILTPSFSTQAGGLDLTPETPTTQRFTVAATAPTLLAVQLNNRTSNGLTLSLQGFSTTRSITAVNVTFSPVPGFNLAKAQFTVDVQQDATVWFQSASSQAFGGQFVVAVPFSFQGAAPNGKTVLDTIASVSVTVSNERGSSKALQTTLQ